MTYHCDTVARMGRDGFEPLRRREPRWNRDGTPYRPRQHHLDTARVARVASAEIDRLLAPKVTAMLDTLATMGRQIDRIKAHRDAERNARPPAGHVRDAATGVIRPRTTRDVAVAAYAVHGRDANGKRPGEPGYNFDGVAMVKAGASWNEINAAFWGRKA